MQIAAVVQEPYADWVAREFVAPIARADVLARLREHLERGEVVALVSGAPTPLVRSIAHMWDVPHAIGSPVEFVKAWYAFTRLRVTGPGLPSPITRPSTFTTGTSSAPVPVTKHSSALKTS